MLLLRNNRSPTHARSLASLRLLDWRILPYQAAIQALNVVRYREKRT
jgi:hypothetical protein